MPKVIAITGAGTGLGRALARRFAADGEQVLLMGRRLEKLETLAAELGPCAHPIACDVASPEAVDAAFAAVQARFDKLDVLINNAGVFKPFLVAEASAEQITETLATNLAGPILCARAAIPMIPRGGHIINVSSETVAHNYYPFLTLYQCSKAGLERFSQNLGHELAAQGIRVTAVRAGPMVDADSGWDMDPEQIMRFHKAITAVGLAGQPTTHFDSVPGVFRAVIDAPADLTTPLVVLGARAS